MVMIETRLCLCEKQQFGGSDSSMELSESENKVAYCQLTS
jgi:hypothetical protein